MSTRTTSSGARKTGRTISGASIPKRTSSAGCTGKCPNRSTRRWAGITRSTRRAISGVRAARMVSRVDAMTGEVVRDLPTQEIRLDLWQRHERRRPLFRRRRLAARRRHRRRHQNRRSVRTRQQPQFGPGARRIRSRSTITGRADAAGCWSNSTSRKSRSSNTACRRPIPLSTRRIPTRMARSGRANRTAAAMRGSIRKPANGSEYVLPEPYGFDRESWIDNSTDAGDRLVHRP